MISLSSVRCVVWLFAPHPAVFALVFAFTIVAADALCDTGAAAEPRRAPTARTPGSPAPQAIVEVRDGRVTLRVEDRPLGWVLDRLSVAARVAIVMSPGIGADRISVSLDAVPVDEALRRLLKGLDAFFYYGDDPGTTGPAVLTTVWVYPRSQGLSLEPAPPDVRVDITQLDRGLASPDARTRARAVEMLVDLRRGEARDAVVQALADPEANVRHRALVSAVLAKVVLPADLVAKLALGDPYPAVRIEALAALIGQPNAREVAQQALTDPDAYVRHKALEVLDERPEKANQRPRSRPARRATPGPEL